MLCGVDEAGRGPLAGPVTAAAVVLPSDFPIDLLNDSKRLTQVKRELIVPVIEQRATAWAVGWASHAEIDRINILRASHLAMLRAVRALGMELEEIVVDGSIAPQLGFPTRALVKADATVPEVMAASILAKVARDRWMVAYGEIERVYEFATHKGYPTTRHRSLIAKHGPSAIHRYSFRSPADRAPTESDRRNAV